MRCCCCCLFPTSTPPVPYCARGECAILVSFGVAGAGQCWADNNHVFDDPLALALTIYDLYRGPSLLPSGTPGVE